MVALNHYKRQEDRAPNSPMVISGTHALLQQGKYHNLLFLLNFYSVAAGSQPIPCMRK
jgi:hypothetical protein